MFTDSKTGFGFLCWAPKVPFLEFPKVLKIALLGSKKMGLCEFTTKIRNHFWNQCPKLTPKLVSDLNFDHFWGILIFWSFLNYKCMYCTINLVRKPHNMKFLNDNKCLSHSENCSWISGVTSTGNWMKILKKTIFQFFVGFAPP